MTRSLIWQAFGWGATLWLFGYLLSFLFFGFVPMALLGWSVMPFALGLTIWVAFRKLQGPSLGHFVVVAAVWTVLAVVLDYFLLVKLLKPADGYYKIDVYLYYALTLLVPLTVGWWKLRQHATPAA